jgi:hypothetical protein
MKRTAAFEDSRTNDLAGFSLAGWIGAILDPELPDREPAFQAHRFATTKSRPAETWIAGAQGHPQSQSKSTRQLMASDRLADGQVLSHLEMMP